MNESDWTPARLLEFSGSYWGVCALHAGLKLELFTRLDRESRTGLALATECGCDHRGLDMLLNALTAMRLLTKSGDCYTNSPVAVERLSRTSPDYMGHILLHHHNLMEGWSRLAQVVRSGQPSRISSSHVESAEERENFLLGMFNMASMLAPQMARQIDLSRRKRLLDFGGGPGTYAIHFALANPDLEAVVFDLPTTRAFAEQTLKRFPVEDRVTFQAGSFHDDFPAGRYDVAWLSHILHGEGTEGCRTILQKAAAVLEPGGMLLIHEFILDDDRCGPLFPALFSLNMLVGTEGGQSYTFAELSGMVREVGGKRIERLQLALPGPSGVIAAIF